MRRRQPQRNNMRLSGATSIALLWCLLATAVLYAVKPATVSAQEGDLKDFDADNFFTREDMEAISAQCENLDYVTKPLFVSDADGNGLLSQNEFAVFTVNLQYLQTLCREGGFRKWAWQAASRRCHWCCRRQTSFFRVYVSCTRRSRGANLVAVAMLLLVAFVRVDRVQTKNQIRFNWNI